MIRQNFGSEEGLDNVSQWETDDAAEYPSISFVPEEKEAGALSVFYGAVNLTTAAAAVREKRVRYKCINGVASVTGMQNQYTNGDTGTNTFDVDVRAANNRITIYIKGDAGILVRHDLHIIKRSSKLKS